MAKYIELEMYVGEGNVIAVFMNVEHITYFYEIEDDGEKKTTVSFINGN